MGIFSDIIEGGNITAGAWSNAIDNFLIGEDSYPMGTKSGARVNEKTALSVTAVYACVRILAWTLAALPIITFRRLKPKGKERATEHRVYKILHNSPNSEMTPFRYKALTSIHQNLYGAGISEIEFDRNGQPVALWPLPPWRVQPLRTKEKALVYRVTLPNGKTQNLAAYKVLVFEALQTHSDRWLSPIGVHRETVGLAMAIKEFGALSFGQGTNPASQLIFPGKFPEEMSEESYRNALAEKYQGLSKSHRLMFTEHGAKFEKVGLPPADIQYLDSQKFSVAEIARMYNVPLFLLNSLEKATTFGKGLEEINRGFVNYTLTPYFVQFEQEFNRKLIFEDDIFTEFLFDALLRGNIKDRYAAYASGRMWGHLNVNEIRELENRNPLPGDEGEVYLSPSNMVTTSELIKIDPTNTNNSNTGDND